MRRLAQLVGGLLLLSAARPGWAYCRSTTCDPKKQDCEIDENGCKRRGKPLQWRSSCVGFSLDEAGSSQIPFDEIKRVLETSLKTWSGRSCPEGPASFSYGHQPDVPCGVVFNPSGPNANVVVFRENDWPYQGLNDTLGYTTVSFSISTGEILGADIEINAAQNIITTTNTAVRYDLQSILTHELGHALGLGHSSDFDATMSANYAEGTLTLRDLASDDVEALCAAYPADRQADCLPDPPGGFSRACTPEPEPRSPSASCALDPAAPGLASLPALALGLAALARLRRRRGSP